MAWHKHEAHAGTVVRAGVIRDDDGTEHAFTERECFRNGTYFGELVGRRVLYWLDDAGAVAAVNGRNIKA